MKPEIFLFLGAAAIVPCTARAQQFTTEQQEVINFINQCWETWGTEDWAALEKTCTTDPGARFWWFAEAVPDGGIAEWKRWAGAFWPRMEASIHYTHRPIAVDMMGDVALYYYWVTWTSADANGQVKTQTQRRLEVMQRRNGGWVWIGGSGAPESDS